MPTKSQINTKEETTSTQGRESPRTQQPENALAHEVTPAAALQRSVSVPPHAPRPLDLLTLQRTVGNRAVSRLIQARRKGGPEGDTYERGAARRMKPAMQRVGGGGAEGFVLDDATAARINRARGGGQPLEGAVQKQMSASLGYDFSEVRVHTDADADALTQQLSAKAFTTGRDLFFGRGAYQPGSTSGWRLIAHELSHVVQQSRGDMIRSQRGVTVRPSGDSFEQEADAVAQVVSRPGGRRQALPGTDERGRAVRSLGPAAVDTYTRKPGPEDQTIQREHEDHVIEADSYVSHATNAGGAAAFCARGIVEVGRQRQFGSLLALGAGFYTWEETGETGNPYRGGPMDQLIFWVTTRDATGLKLADGQGALQAEDTDAITAEVEFIKMGHEINWRYPPRRINEILGSAHWPGEPEEV